MSALTSTFLNNFADVCLSLPQNLIEAGVKQNSTIIDSKGFDGKTALQKAVLAGNLNVAKLLLQNGADPNFESNSGEAAVHLACSRGSLKMLVLLLHHGADPTLADAEGGLPVHYAARVGSLLLVQYLHEVCEVDFDAKDSKGMRPLHYASASGHLDLVKYLVQDKKVNRLSTDDARNTSLHHGVYSGESSICWHTFYPRAASLLLSVNSDDLSPTELAESLSSVSPDCRKWLARWTNDYKRLGYVESPQWTWAFYLLMPFVAFHLSLVLSAIATPHRQWILGIPSAGALILTIQRQNHRLNHPCGWPNPIYVGCYIGGVISTLICYATVVKRPSYQSALLTLLDLVVIASHCALTYKLLTGDPGRIINENPIKETLRAVGESLSHGYCTFCQISIPPLSHHCRLCSSCHYQLDHHCLFLNKCIAGWNHWHFVMFLLTNLLLMMKFIFAVVYASFVKFYKNYLFADLIIACIYLLEEDMWTFNLLILNIFSFIWNCCLLR